MEYCTNHAVSLTCPHKLEVCGLVVLCPQSVYTEPETFLGNLLWFLAKIFS